MADAYLSATFGPNITDFCRHGALLSIPLLLTNKVIAVRSIFCPRVLHVLYIIGKNDDDRMCVGSRALEVASKQAKPHYIE